MPLDISEIAPFPKGERKGHVATIDLRWSSAYRGMGNRRANIYHRLISKVEVGRKGASQAWKGAGESKRELCGVGLGPVGL